MHGICTRFGSYHDNDRNNKGRHRWFEFTVSIGARQQSVLSNDRLTAINDFRCKAPKNTKTVTEWKDGSTITHCLREGVPQVSFCDFVPNCFKCTKKDKKMKVRDRHFIDTSEIRNILTLICCAAQMSFLNSSNCLEAPSGTDGIHQNEREIYVSTVQDGQGRCRQGTAPCCSSRA